MLALQMTRQGAVVLVVLLSGVLLVAAMKSDASAQTYKNPVLDIAPGNYVFFDPKSKQYIMSMTGRNAKGALPLQVSKNLIDWTSAGYIFPAGAPGNPTWDVETAGPFTAPEIRYINGKYIAVFSCACKGPIKDGGLGGHGAATCYGVAHASNPLGPWTDVGRPVVKKDYWNFFDPSLIQDVKSKTVYLTIKGYDMRGGVGWIYIKSMNKAMTKITRGKWTPLIKKKKKWEGAGSPHALEGTHMFYKKPYYYLFYTGGDWKSPQCSYKIGVARARKVTGPYEKFPKPIVSASETWCNPGSPSVVPLVNDRKTFALFLNANYKSVKNERSGVVDMLLWKNGWPTIRKGRVSSWDCPVPNPGL